MILCNPLRPRNQPRSLRLVVILLITVSWFNAAGSHTFKVQRGEDTGASSRDTLPDTMLTKDEKAALRSPFSLLESEKGQVAYMRNCQFCHGADRMGAAAPSVFKVNNRILYTDFKTLVRAGRAQMPGFRQFDQQTLIALYKYLSDMPVDKKSVRRN